MSTASQDERDYRRRLGKVIVQLREATAMSQATLAELINRSEAALSRWETGKSTPTAYDLRQLARTFGLYLEDAEVLINPPAVYGPEMERVFAGIAKHLTEAAASGVEEGTRRGRQNRPVTSRPTPAPSPVPRPRGTGARSS